MLETVLVLPLHIVALLGVMWLGMLTLDRERLAELDFMWAMEQMHMTGFTADQKTAALSGMQTKIFQETDYFEITDATPAQAAGSGWTRSYSSRLKLSQELPEWLAGLNFFFAEKDADDNLIQTYETTLDMAASGEPGAVTATSYVVGRNPDYSTARETATDWEAIAEESFPGTGNSSPVVTVNNPVTEYNRNGNFNTWSALP